MNDVFIKHVRTGRCHYIRGEPARLNSEGVVVQARKEKKGAAKPTGQKETTKSGHVKIEEIPEGQEKVIPADVIILATGYKKPSVDFLPDDLFPEGYEVRDRHWCGDCNAYELPASGFVPAKFFD